jgi:hypothetical protein
MVSNTKIGSPDRIYEITDSDLIMMLECLKEDERRNRAMTEAGYSSSGVMNRIFSY